MKKSAFVFFLILSMFGAHSQSYEISFAGKGAATTVDSVIVENLTQGTTESLGGNDILSLVVTIGLDEMEADNEDHILVYPNPATGTCQIGFETAFPGNTTFTLFDIAGKKIWLSQEKLAAGFQSFSLSGLHNGLYTLKITSDKYSHSVKIISMNSENGQVELRHIGTSEKNKDQKAFEGPGNKAGLKKDSSVIEMPYTTGDILKFRGRSGVHRAITMLVPTGNQVVTFTFNKCTDDEDQNYATVQIGSQFWVAENLNAGVRINSFAEQVNNGILEKYCLYDDEANCDSYGALYQWDEMMAYEPVEGARGACPHGFHVATATEWATMVDYLGGEAVAGGKLKEAGFNHWNYPNEGATDASGFNGLPGGYVNPDGSFANQNNTADVWTSSPDSPGLAKARVLSSADAGAVQASSDRASARSCRCIQDNAVEMTMLAGDTSKTWKLLRDVSAGRYPLEVGPADHSAIWWAMGFNNNELANRICMLNDEWTFGRDFSMVFDAKGDYWAEGGIFDPGNSCTTTDNMMAVTGEDCSAWGSGTHQFGLATGADPKLKALGNGAFVGFFKSATEYEVMDLDPMVQDSVAYNLVMLTDGPTDTLIVETFWYDYVGAPEYLGYWRYALVHYDNPEDEPPLPGFYPTASFEVNIDGLTVTCTNTSSHGETYLWDFGDGTTDTTMHATHTYASDSIYIISLTVTNELGSDMVWKEVFVSDTPLTDAGLQGGPWKVRISDYSIFVGPAMGDNSWWSVPVEFLDGSYIGTSDDWSCITDDEFTFSAGGVLTYDGTGVVRNDGYFGYPNGCWPESALQGNAAYFKSGTHSYIFTPASGSDRPVITLTNGTGRAAFMGFYKGYYGGENTDINNPPNGGFPTNTYEVMGYANTADKEYLFISVDISPDHSGTAAWSAVLERE
jgi:uncharacterized protein (TIGR02145 family)